MATDGLAQNRSADCKDKIAEGAADCEDEIVEGTADCDDSKAADTEESTG